MIMTDPPPSYEARPNKYIHLANLILVLRDIKVENDDAARAFRLYCLDLQRLQAMIEVGDNDTQVDEAQVQVLIQLIKTQWPSLPKEKCELRVGQRLQTAYAFAQKELLDAFPHNKTRMQRVVNFARENPKTAFAGAALVAVGTPIVAPALLVGGLNVVGFGPLGPVAGSLAASIQSVVYGGAVGSGSLFAMAQGAAMGGVAVATVPEIVLGAVAVTTGAGMVAKAASENSEEKKDDSKPENKTTC